MTLNYSYYRVHGIGWKEGIICYSHRVEKYQNLCGMIAQVARIKPLEDIKEKRKFIATYANRYERG